MTIIDVRAAAAHRLRLTAWTLALIALSIPVCIPLFVFTVVGLPLIGVFGAGIPLVLGAVWLTRQLAWGHRRVFARSLQVPISSPYRPWPPGHPGRQVWGLVREPATWRDLLWLLVNSTVGFASYLLVVVCVAGVVWWGTAPLLWWVLARTGGAETAQAVVGADFGVWAIDSQGNAMAGLVIALAFLLLWWWLTPPVLRGYARLCALLLGPGTRASLTARVQQLTQSRAETVDASAAELRRIERDLHDGAQARLVSLGMSLGMAEELLRTDPEAAARLLAEARADSGLALAELRELVRGMHPPVLADRGLPGAVAALALVHPLAVKVAEDLPGRPPAPVESAAYFAVAEALTNVSKHARATSAQVRLRYDEGRLLITVTDDGEGGATAAAGGGLDGLARRLSAFDGTVNITSPTGGPTIVSMEIPCELSSEKTTPS